MRWKLRTGFHGPIGMVAHAISQAPLWLAIAGVAAAYYCYMVSPPCPRRSAEERSDLRAARQQYYMDKFNDIVFAGGARMLSRGVNAGDRADDGLIVNNGQGGQLVLEDHRLWQSGYITMHS